MFLMIFRHSLFNFKFCGTPYKSEEKNCWSKYRHVGVSIQRSWTGKLALCSQNFYWMALSQEKAQKPIKFGLFANRSDLRGFWAFS